MYKKDFKTDAYKGGLYVLFIHNLKKYFVSIL